MVDTLRQDTVPFRSVLPMQGLYVVGTHNRISGDMPRLPKIVSSQAEAEPDSIISVSDESELTENRIYSAGLYDNFASGDVVWLDARTKRMRTILSSKSTANTLLVTERCDNRCTFCCQPPNELPDTELYLRASLSILNFDSADYVGISGGEPTYNRHGFITLLKTLGRYGNRTPLHILTNGRSFSDYEFSKEVAALVDDRRVLWGVPLYGHRGNLHDFLVGASGAFVDTVQGLLHLGEQGQAIELRVIPVQANIDYLDKLLMFITSQLPFVTTVSVMNLEPKGWARKNFDALYVSVKQQNQKLLAAVRIAESRGIDIHLFNYPLCLLSHELRPFAEKTISDWKNYYPSDCTDCRLRESCGGFFASATGKFIEKVEVQL